MLGSWPGSKYTTLNELILRLLPFYFPIFHGDVAVLTDLTGLIVSQISSFVCADGMQRNL